MVSAVKNYPYLHKNVKKKGKRSGVWLHNPIYGKRKGE